MVVQIIPTFAMGCFKLLLGFCRDIKMLIRKFWWGQRGERRKIHRKSGKYCASLIKKRDWVLRSLQSSMMLYWQSKYGDLVMIKPFYSIVFLSQNTFQTGPFSMQNLVRVFCLEKFLKARKIILMGAKWRVGDGLSIRVFKDNWLPGVVGG